MAKYDKDHYEVPDKTPVELPIGAQRPESLEQMIARMVQNKFVQAEMQDKGLETFEEADDFEVGENTEFTSEHEVKEMQPEYPVVDRRKKQVEVPVKKEKQEVHKKVEKQEPEAEESESDE